MTLCTSVRQENDTRNRTENGDNNQKRSVSLCCPSTIVESNVRKTQHGQNEITPKQWQRYEDNGKSRSISAANQHDQPNQQIKLVLSKLSATASD